MFFKMQVDHRIFYVNIKESQDVWDISISKEKAQDTIKKYQIPKSEYQDVDGVINLFFKNKCHIINMTKNETGYFIDIKGSYKNIIVDNEEILLQKKIKGGHTHGEDQVLTAKMPGKIVDILVKPKDKVVKGQPILIMEAMKMENEMRADSNTSVQSIKVKKGESVEAGAVLVIFEKQEGKTQ